MCASLASVRDECQCISFLNHAACGKSGCSADAECRKWLMHRMERSLLGRQNRVKSKGFVFKHVLANRFTGSGVRPDAEGSRRRIPGLGVGNRIVDGEVEL